jgi:carbamoyl-phosphate synthase large subunit
MSALAIGLLKKGCTVSGSDLIKNNEISLLINTTEGKESIQDSSSIRRTALDNKIPCTTTLQGGLAICEVLEKRLDWSVQNIQDIHKSIE